MEEDIEAQMKILTNVTLLVREKGRVSSLFTAETSCCSFLYPIMFQSSNVIANVRGQLDGIRGDYGLVKHYFWVHL